jgi:hypothetical protein
MEEKSAHYCFQGRVNLYIQCSVNVLQVLIMKTMILGFKSAHAVHTSLSVLSPHFINIETFFISVSLQAEVSKDTDVWGA